MNDIPPRTGDLRYPIGPFVPPETVTPPEVQAWIADMAALPGPG